jgi:DNA-binding transcriptional LysR family regulator
MRMLSQTCAGTLQVKKIPASRHVPMEHLRSIGVFVRTVELRSFAAAAAALMLTPSAVSKAVGALERSLGVRLLVRGARGVGLTEEGGRFYARCRTIVSELEAAEREATGSRSVPRGRLRLALHSGLARGRILAHMPRFLRANPQLQVEVLLATGSRSLEAEGIDIGVFIGEPGDSALVARHVADLKMLTCASPSYLDVHGVPRLPEELAGHNCMVYFRPNGRRYDEWTFLRGDDVRAVRVHGSYGSNEAHVLTEAAIAGIGFTRIFDIGHPTAIASGALTAVLTDWEQPGPPVHVMYPRAARSAPKVRVFADFVTALFADADPPVTPPAKLVRWPMYRTQSKS